MENNNLTGYPSIDKPWLKYYSEEAINATIPKMTMYQYVWENNKDNLSDISLVFYGTRITYDKLFKNIKSAARAFYSMGVRAGDIVTIMSLHTPETITAIYALNYLGAVANMIYMTLSETEIVHTLQKTNSKMFLALDVALERLNAIKNEINIPVVILGVADSMPPYMKLGYALKTKSTKCDFNKWTDFLRFGENKELPPLVLDNSLLAVIVYTSGTTGEPKGVMLSSDNLNSVVLQCCYSGKNYQRGETSLFFLPPFTGYGFAMLHLGLAVGLIMNIILEFDPEKIAQKFNNVKPNRFVAGVAHIDAIMKNVSGDLSYLIDFTGGGEAISVEKEREFNLFLSQHNSPAKYTTGYGMTEFASVVCMQMNHVFKPGSLGIPLPKVIIKIIDTESGKECGFNKIGELCFYAPNTMMGYYKNENAVKEIEYFDEEGRRFLRTGDLGYIDESTYQQLVQAILDTSYMLNAYIKGVVNDNGIED